MLFQSLTVSEATHQLMNDDYACWSYDGAYALANHLDDIWEDCGPPEFGFCVAAIRCDYTEMSPSGLVDCYGYLLDRDLPSDATLVVECEEIMEELKALVSDNSHCLIELDNGNFIVGLF